MSRKPGHHAPAAGGMQRLVVGLLVVLLMSACEGANPGAAVQLDASEDSAGRVVPRSGDTTSDHISGEVTGENVDTVVWQPDVVDLDAGGDDDATEDADGANDGVGADGMVADGTLVDAAPDAVAADDAAADSGGTDGSVADSAGAAAKYDVGWPVSGSAAVSPANLGGKCGATVAGGVVGTACTTATPVCVIATYDTDGVCRSKAKTNAVCAVDMSKSATACVSGEFGVCTKDGECEPVILVGQPCATSDPCTVGVCGANGSCKEVVTPGALCGTSPDQCTEMRCSKAGACVATPSFSACKPTDPCRPSGLCDGKGKCVGPVIPGLTCGASTNPCLSMRCATDGACVGVPNIGATCGGPDACHGAGICGAAGVCNGSVKVGADCGDGKNPCVKQTCSLKGTCETTPLAGKVCSPNKVCHTGLCSSKGVCEATVTKGATCVIGVSGLTNKQLRCVKGGGTNPYKIGGLTGTCDAKGVCLIEKLPDGAACLTTKSRCEFSYVGYVSCLNQLYCMQGGTCQAGVCINEKPDAFACESKEDSENANTSHPCSQWQCCTGLATDPPNCKALSFGRCAMEPYADGTPCSMSGGTCKNGGCMSPQPDLPSTDPKLAFTGVLPPCPDCWWEWTPSTPIPWEAKCVSKQASCAPEIAQYGGDNPCIDINSNFYCLQDGKPSDCVTVHPDGTCCGPGLACKSGRCSVWLKP